MNEDKSSGHKSRHDPQKSECQNFRRFIRKVRAEVRDKNEGRVVTLDFVSKENCHDLPNGGPKGRWKETRQ